MDLKESILKHLKTENDVVSGSRLSDRLEVSRVSVWKHIQQLQKMGYPIVSTKIGYRLDHVPDLLYSWEFPGRESKIHYHAEVGSTMDAARDLARNGCEHLSVVIAGKQNSGRGRLKRSWLSAQGGLYFTVILRPKIPPVTSPMLTFSASVALARTLREVFAVNAQVKWPNDILISGKKVAGILAEMEAEGDLVSHMNIGIGINVNNDPTDKGFEATSLSREIKAPVSRRQLLEEFLNRFEETSKPDALDGIINEWKRYAGTLNRPVRVVTLRDTTEGTAVDVDETGALIIKDGQGKLRRIICGDCFQI